MQLASRSEDSQDSQDQDEQEEKGSDKQQSSEEAEDEGEKGETGPKDSCYKFSLTETTILEVVMDSMRTCGLALALQALSTLLLGEQGFVWRQSLTLQSAAIELKQHDVSMHVTSLTVTDHKVALLCLLALRSHGHVTMLL